MGESTAAILDNLGWKPSQDENGATYWLAKSNLSECAKLGDVALEPMLVSVARDSFLRNRISEALRGMGQVAVQPLLKILTCIDSNAQVCAIEVLGHSKDSRAVEPLIALLQEKGLTNRFSVIRALGELGDSRAVEALTIVLKSNSSFSPQCRDEAVVALVRIGGDGALNGFIVALADPDVTVRRRAVFALGQVCAAQIVVPLVGALTDSDPSVRQHATEALGRVNDPRAVPALIGALSDHNLPVRVAAAHALAQAREPRLEPLIAPLLVEGRQKDLEERRNAIDAFKAQKEAEEFERWEDSLRN